MLEDLLYPDVHWLLWRMLRLHRPYNPTQEPMGWRGAANPAGPSHGLALFPGSIALHNDESASAVLWS